MIKLKFSNIFSNNLIMRGVYCIRTVDGKYKYFGSSKNFLQRLKKHRAELKKNSHSNDILQRIYNKYGADYFNIYIQPFPSADDFALLLIEEDYINKFDGNINICKFPATHQVSWETKRKISIKSSQTVKNNYKTIYVYDNYGKYLFEHFGSKKELCSKLEIQNVSTINRLLLNNKSGRINYIVSYLPPNSNYSVGKMITQYDSNGCFVKHWVNGLDEISEEMGVCKQTIINNLYGRGFSTHSDYIWKYNVIILSTEVDKSNLDILKYNKERGMSPTRKSLLQLDIDNKIIKEWFCSIHKLAKTFDIPRHVLQYAINRGNTINNLKFIYNNDESLYTVEF